MIILSLNVQGLGGLAKQKGLRHLFSSLLLDIILLQETMNSTYPALLAFSKLCLGWELCATNSSGLSRGILSKWNPHFVKCKAFHTFAGILLKAWFRGSTTTLSILNFYGPYLHQETFWNSVARGGLLSLPKLILAGDLNLTLNGSEIWGPKAIPDPLGPFFTNFFLEHHLADIAPTCAGPT